MDTGVPMVRDVDRGWAWVALGVTVLILSLQAAYITSVGLFLVEFLETFSGSTGFIALIGALAVGGQTLLGPVAGILSQMLTHRAMIMTGGITITLGLVLASFSQDLPSLLLLFGVVCGVGTGLTYSPAVTVVSMYFRRYRTVASGVTLGAPGLGVMVTPYLIRWLIHAFGWRVAMVAFACLMAQTCVLGSLLFPHQSSPSPSSCWPCQSKPQAPPPASQSSKPCAPSGQGRLKELRNAEVRVMVGSRTAMHVSEFGSVLLSNSVVWTVEEVKVGLLRQLRQLLRQRFMWVMCLNQTLLMSGLSIHFVLFPSYVHTLGVNYDDLPELYTVFGATMMVCRVAGGFIFSLVPQHMLKVFFAMQLCVAIVLLLLPVYGVTLPALFVFKFLIGVTYGPTFLLVAPILIHYVGLQDLSVAFGVVMLCCGCGYVSAPPLGGMMYDFFGSYKVSYYIAGLTVGVAAMSLLLLLLIKDLQPLDDPDLNGGQGLMSSSGKESEDGNDDSGSTDTKGDDQEEKPGVNDVHVIDDMEDLCKFIDDRPS